MALITIEVREKKLNRLILERSLFQGKMTMVVVVSVSAGCIPAILYLWYPFGGQGVYFLPEQGKITESIYEKKWRRGNF